MSLIFLSELKNNESAVVSEVLGEDQVSLRLMEMGLVPGTCVTRIGAAPLGDPLEFELLGFSLSLRLAEAKRVQLQSEVSPGESDQ